MIVEWLQHRQPKIVGLLTGSVAGLATITPAAGYVSLADAAAIGIIASLVCYVAVALKNRIGLDDALDVWGVHGVGGLIGTILLGVFAEKAWNPAGSEGLLNGGIGFFLKQCAAVVFAGVWGFVSTYVMLWIIDQITPVRVSHEMEEQGLGAELLGEAAYAQ
jgi:ammonium transporter, Amt family